MNSQKLKINEQSITNELKSFKDKPFDCLVEYIWNSFDADATEVKLDFNVPIEGIGLVEKVQITDNGKGWDFDDDAITNNFISSTKKPRDNNTLPKGQYGRGRYSFIWISKKISALSKDKKLILQHNTEIIKEKSGLNPEGTIINFEGIYEDFSNILLSDNLHIKLVLEFGWFLLENSQFKIFVNGTEINVNENIKLSKEYFTTSFPEDIRSKLQENFNAKIVLWKEKPSEYSKFYYLNESNIEISKENTSFNKKSDDFWHSVYIRSFLCNSFYYNTSSENDLNQNNQLFNHEDVNQIKKKIIKFLKEELVLLRKPFLKIQSTNLLIELKKQRLMPELNDYGIFDKNSFEDLIKIIYTISPSLFVGKSNTEKKFICATFAGLLSSQDDNLIKTILEQIHRLTDEEKQELNEILKRTSFSNIIKTIKEIDHRLEVIDKLQILISDHKKETLEVMHLQKILDENFWLFGEQFRLFSSTEGPLKKVLVDYAKEILKIKNPELETNPNGEVDLFLTKTEQTSETKQLNIIVEIKRPSKDIGKKEYDQMYEYMNSIKDQALCNSGNQYWEFYLIGKNYDSIIENNIESAKNHGQQDRGLCYNIKDGKFKIYVRKWSDILQVEWGTKMKFLKEKLQIQAKQAKITPQEITEELID